MNKLFRWLFGSRTDIPEPYEDVRMAVGRYKYHPHQWVEVWNGKFWDINDPTLGRTEAKYYTTSHHLEWEMVMKAESKLKELKERQQ